MNHYTYKGVSIEITAFGMHKFYSSLEQRFLQFDNKRSAKEYIREYSQD